MAEFSLATGEVDFSLMIVESKRISSSGLVGCGDSGVLFLPVDSVSMTFPIWGALGAIDLTDSVLWISREF